MSAPPPGPALGPRSGDRPHQDRPCARARARASSEEPTDSPPLAGAGDPAASRLPAGARNIGGGTRAVGRRRILQCLAHSLARAGCWGPAGGPPAPCGPRVVMGPPGSSKEVRSRFGAEGVDNYGKEGGSVAPSSLLLMLSDQRRFLQSDRVQSQRNSVALDGLLDQCSSVRMVGCRRLLFVLLRVV